MAKVKLALLAWQYRKEIAMLVVAAIFAMTLGMAVVASLFASPAASDEQVGLYLYATQELKDETGLILEYRIPLALDAVRLEQDFSGVTLETVRQTVRLFVTTTIEPGESCTDENGDGKDDATGRLGCTCVTAGDPPVTICVLPDMERPALRSLDEVMADLGFTAEQQEITRIMASADDGEGYCIGFIPVEQTYTWPANGVITSCFGVRWDPVEGGYHHHWGIDIAAEQGTPIRAAHSATVIYAGYAGNYGNLLILSSDSEDMHTWYGHLHSFGVTRGQHVSRGQVIGTMGSTGKSTGPHLHFEMRRDSGATPVNPITYYRY